MPGEHPSHARNALAFQRGLTEEEVCQRYNEWSDYDKHMCVNVYNGPQFAADAVSTHLKNKDARILDVGAGTGRIGEHLKEYGYFEIDALEPSDLAQQAYEKKVYRNVIDGYFGWEASSHTMIEDESYDCIVSSGVYGESHLKLDSIDETIRILRPGGICVIVMRENYLHATEEYRNKLEPYMENLVDQGKWEFRERSRRADYFVNLVGIVFVYRKV